MKFNKIMCISDLHLSEEATVLNENFLALMGRIPESYEALFILGDLFDWWPGDDAINAYYKTIASALRALHCPVFFLPGNRDYLPNKKWLKLANASRLPDTHSILVANKKVTFLHGDELCTEDVGYQKLRKITRKYWLQWLYQKIPLSLKNKIAKQFNRSNLKKKPVSNRVYAPVESAINQIVKQEQCDILVHGHIHQVGIYPKNSYTRVVLPDWRPNHYQSLTITKESIVLN